MKIKTSQVRYIRDGDSRNYPVGITAQDLISGAFLKDSIRITELTISGLYGLKFYINDTPTPLEILPESVNLSNVFAADAISWTFDSKKNNNMPIYSIRIDCRSLARFLQYNKNSDDFLFINYSYQVSE